MDGEKGAAGDTPSDEGKCPATEDGKKQPKKKRCSRGGERRRPSFECLNPLPVAR